MSTSVFFTGQFQVVYNIANIYFLVKLVYQTYLCLTDVQVQKLWTKWSMKS